MQSWLPIPVYAAIGLSFTGCEPRQLQDSDAQDTDAPVVEVPDPLVGQWRSVEVEHYDDLMVTQTVTMEMTIENDLTGAVAVAIDYDYPGTEYDDNYDYTLTLTAETIGGAQYRIDFRNPAEGPEHPGTLTTCTRTEDSLLCEPDDKLIAPLSFTREV